MYKRIKGHICKCVFYKMVVVAIVLGFYIPPTAKVIRRRDIGLKSHPKDSYKMVICKTCFLKMV